MRCSLICLLALVCFQEETGHMFQLDAGLPTLSCRRDCPGHIIWSRVEYFLVCPVLVSLAYLVDCRSGDFAVFLRNHHVVVEPQLPLDLVALCLFRS